MATELSMSTLDRKSKKTSTRHNIADAATDPQVQSLVDAWDAIILGAAIKGTKSVPTVIDAGSQVPPADDNANATEKWMARVQDDVTGVIYRHELGTADSTHLPTPTTDLLDLTAGVGAALKTALELIYKSPDGNDGTLLSVQYVTRSSA